MKELKPRIHENGIDYILVSDYYVPDWNCLLYTSPSPRDA